MNNFSSMTRRPAKPSRPKIECNYPECSLGVAKNRLNDHLMRAHSKCPWCNFEGNNREELIEHLQVIKSDAYDKNNHATVYFCLLCMNFVTTYCSDFKKHGCRNKKIILLHQK